MPASLKKTVSRLVSPALPIDALRNGLHASHLPCRVVWVGRDAVKVTPGQGISVKAVEAFVDGFLAGFAA